MVRFLSIASGSSGNCYYLGCDEGAILIDAGLALRTITKSLAAHSIAIPNHIMGVLVTHEHTDHIKGIGALLRAHHLPLFASEPTLHAIARSRAHKQSLEGAVTHVVTQGIPFVLGGFEVTPFCVPHDCACNMGYHIRRGDFSFTLITDAGHITQDMYFYAQAAKYIVLESNYDPLMLQMGRYTPLLKERVAGNRGHLSNIESARFLGNIYHPEMSHVWLCHLSHENNLPEVCYQTFEQELTSCGISLETDLNLEILRRTTPSQLYLLNE